MLFSNVAISVFRRIILINGEPVGCLNRVPAEGEFRSNLGVGGLPELSELSSRDIEICQRIRKTLIDYDLYFVGIDVIGGKLVEVNVMSPGGITYINKVYKNKRKVEEKVIDFLESKVLDQLQAFDRRARLRKTVEEA